MNTDVKQPKALYVIVCTQMWECFSFYGMRVLLVLYMISQMHFTDSQAFGIFALYTGLVELGGVIGGIIADRLLGLKRAISLGGWLIMSGHFTLALGSQDILFFPALALIILGSSLFTTNLSALLGLYYEEEDARRESGFTLYYAGINFGALLASLLCGYVGETFGWHYGFGLAAIGMLIGNTLFYGFGHILDSKGKNLSLKRSKNAYALMAMMTVLGIFLVAQSLAYESEVLSFLPVICVIALAYVAFQLLKSDRQGWIKMTKLMLYLLGLAIFFGAEEQAGSSLILFSERHGSGNILGINIPSTAIISVNPAVIIMIGAFMNRLFSKLKQGSFPYRLVVPFVMASIAFAGLSGACTWFSNHEAIPLIFIMGMIGIISLAELMIGPAVYCLCSESVTPRHQGMVMGLVPIGFSLASSLGGYFSKWMAVEQATSLQSLVIYQNGFAMIAAVLLTSGIILGICLIMISGKESKKEDRVLCEI